MTFDDWKTTNPNDGTYDNACQICHGDPSVCCPDCGEVGDFGQLTLDDQLTAVREGIPVARASFHNWVDRLDALIGSGDDEEVA